MLKLILIKWFSNTHVIFRREDFSLIRSWYNDELLNYRIYLCEVRDFLKLVLI